MHHNVVYNVADLDPVDRRAIEHVIGHSLSEGQQLVINVVDAAGAPSHATSSGCEVPAWWNVYEGLSDEQVESLDRAIRQRADLARASE